MLEPSRQALFRYLVVSQVQSRMLSGKSRAEAVRAVAALQHRFFDKGVRRVSVRSVYRWLCAYESKGLVGLEPGTRQSTLDPDVLPTGFVDFLIATKKLDARVSVPELIRRARELGLVEPHQKLDRSTVYRTCVRLGLPVGRTRKQPDRDTRRFAYPHRMDMVLADGKHFRAGAQRRKRLAFVFLDDCTRFVLHLVVGTSENAALFLRGLYETIRKYGLMSILYLDHGPGFIAECTARVVGNLGGRLVHGEAAYPEGHGKIERFNRTWLADQLRGLDRRPDVDPSCRALELRLGHYAQQVYNLRPHESLGAQTPTQRFQADPKPLRFPRDDAALHQKFEILVDRRVSADHVVSVDGVLSEMPRGYAGQRVLLHQRLLDSTLAFLHEGRFIKLQPLDVHQNARARRGQRQKSDDVQHPLPPSAADLAFEHDFGPAVEGEGGFTDPDEENES